jgi:hypothetical protein
MHKFFDRVAQLAGSINATFAAMSEEMLFELKRCLSRSIWIPRKTRQSHQISVSVYKDKNKRVTVLASGLSFVFFSAFFNLFVVAFEGAVVV